MRIEYRRIELHITPAGLLETAEVEVAILKRLQADKLIRWAVVSVGYGQAAFDVVYLKDDE